MVKCLRIRRQFPPTPTFPFQLKVTNMCKIKALWLALLLFFAFAMPAAATIPNAAIAACVLEVGIDDAAARRLQPDKVITIEGASYQIKRHVWGTCEHHLAVTAAQPATETREQQAAAQPAATGTTPARATEAAPPPLPLRGTLDIAPPHVDRRPTIEPKAERPAAPVEREEALINMGGIRDVAEAIDMNLLTVFLAALATIAAGLAMLLLASAAIVVSLIVLAVYLIAAVPFVALVAVSSYAAFARFWPSAFKRRFRGTLESFATTEATFLQDVKRGIVCAFVYPTYYLSRKSFDKHYAEFVPEEEETPAEAIVETFTPVEDEPEYDYASAMDEIEEDLRRTPANDLRPPAAAAAEHEDEAPAPEVVEDEDRLSHGLALDRRFSKIEHGEIPGERQNTA